MKRNYQKELEKIIEKEDSGKRLLLHSCCAPCSSYVLVYLRQFFRITVFYYNPNITLSEEYKKRVAEQKRLIAALNAELKEAQNADEKQPGFLIEVMEGSYEPERFLTAVKGMEQCPEGGERCQRCFEIRLLETARWAKQGDYDYFTTTLTISPLKNAEKLNEVGEWAAKQYETAYLPSDFKKKDGYKQSIELSRRYELYRQDYCGCIFSKAERDKHLARMDLMGQKAEMQ